MNILFILLKIGIFLSDSTKLKFWFFTHFESYLGSLKQGFLKGNRMFLKFVLERSVFSDQSRKS